MGKTATASILKLAVRIPESLSDIYAERAAKFGRSVEDEIAIRLRDCAGHTAAQPLYFSDDQRSALSVILGRTIKDTVEALHEIRQALTVKVAGTEVQLSPQLLKRLESRRFGSTLPELLQRVINQTLEEYVGMR